MATPAPPGAQKKADLQTGNSVPPLIDESDPNVLYVMQPGHVIPPQSAPTNKADIDNRPGSSAECSLTCCPMTLERVTRTCGSARVTPTYVEWDVVDVRGSRSIGTGTYGTVTRSDVHWLHPTDVANGLFAIKEYICREEYNDIPLDGNAIREVTMARNVRFPATGACKAALHPKTGVFRMFMNCAQDTLLAAAASGGIDNIGRFPPAALTRERVAVIEDLAFQAILSVAYLHVKGIAHCDVKPDNFLLHNACQTHKRCQLDARAASGMDGTGTVTVTDFGTSETYTIPPLRRRREFFTTWYRPPEFFSGSTVVSGEELMIGDAWALGATIFAMCISHQPPWGVPDDASDTEALARMFFYVGVPEDGADSERLRSPLEIGVWSNSRQKLESYVTGALEGHPPNFLQGMPAEWRAKIRPPTSWLPHPDLEQLPITEFLRARGFGEAFIDSIRTLLDPRPDKRASVFSVLGSPAFATMRTTHPSFAKITEAIAKIFDEEQKADPSAGVVTESRACAYALERGCRDSSPVPLSGLFVMNVRHEFASHYANLMARVVRISMRAWSAASGSPTLWKHFSAFIDMTAWLVVQCVNAAQNPDRVSGASGIYDAVNLLLSISDVSAAVNVGLIYDAVATRLTMGAHAICDVVRSRRPAKISVYEQPTAFACEGLAAALVTHPEIRKLIEEKMPARTVSECAREALVMLDFDVGRPSPGTYATTLAGPFSRISPSHETAWNAFMSRTRSGGISALASSDLMASFSVQHIGEFLALEAAEFVNDSFKSETSARLYAFIKSCTSAITKDVIGAMRSMIAFRHSTRFGIEKRKDVSNNIFYK